MKVLFNLKVGQKKELLLNLICLNCPDCPDGEFEKGEKKRNRNCGFSFRGLRISP